MENCPIPIAEHSGQNFVESRRGFFQNKENKFGIKAFLNDMNGEYLLRHGIFGGTKDSVRLRMHGLPTEIRCGPIDLVYLIIIGLNLIIFTNFSSH